MSNFTHAVVNRPKLFALAGLASLLGLTKPAPESAKPKPPKWRCKPKSDGLSDRAYFKRKARMQMARESRRANRL